MSEVVVYIIFVPLGALLYLSGLLLWPFRRWLTRKRVVRGKALGVACLVQLLSYVAIGIMAAFGPKLLEHGYYWCIILIPLNILFTFVGGVAWIRDSAYEHSLDEGQTIGQSR